jgi:hypothetical protein
VNFAAEPDPALRERMMAIPTSLELPLDDVRLLREYGARARRAMTDEGHRDGAIVLTANSTAALFHWAIRVIFL